MRDQHDRRVEAREVRLEPLERGDVEVVRRLVEEQQIGIAGQRAPERSPRQLASGERAERPVEVDVVAKAEAVKSL